MFISLQNILNWLILYKYEVIFPVTVVEGPIVTVIAGFLASQGILNLYLTYLIIVAGDLTGDLLYYAIGRWGGIRFVQQWGHWFGIKEKQIKRLEKHYEKHSGKTLIIGKITHGVGSVILFTAGMARMSVWRFFWFNVIGTLPKSLLFLLIGYYFGESYKVIDTYLNLTAKTTIGVAVGLVLIYLLVVNILKKTEENGK